MASTFLRKTEDGYEWSKERGPTQATKPKWPMYSDGAAVHPSQIDEHSQFAKAMGVPVEFSKDGRPKLDSHAHRRKYLKIRGFFDRAGYS